jgi:hypothetical protein
MPGWTSAVPCRPVHSPGLRQRPPRRSQAARQSRRHGVRATSPGMAGSNQIHCRRPLRHAVSHNGVQIPARARSVLSALRDGSCSQGSSAMGSLSAGGRAQHAPSPAVAPLRPPQPSGWPSDNRLGHGRPVPAGTTVKTQPDIGFSSGDPARSPLRRRPPAHGRTARTFAVSQFRTVAVCVGCACPGRFARGRRHRQEAIPFTGPHVARRRGPHPDRRPSRTSIRLYRPAGGPKGTMPRHGRHPARCPGRPAV